MKITSDRKAAEQPVSRERSNLNMVGSLIDFISTNKDGIGLQFNRISPEAKKQT